MHEPKDAPDDVVSQVPYHVVCSGSLAVHCGGRNTPLAGTECFQFQVLMGARWIGSLFYGDEGQQP